MQEGAGGTAVISLHEDQWDLVPGYWVTMSFLPIFQLLGQKAGGPSLLWAAAGAGAGAAPARWALGPASAWTDGLGWRCSKPDGDDGQRRWAVCRQR